MRLEDFPHFSAFFPRQTFSAFAQVLRERAYLLRTRRVAVWGSDSHSQLSDLERPCC
jgi:hypothetical protein